jgi:hypothetical protein
MKRRFIRTTIGVLAVGLLVLAGSVNAALVTWDLNPSNQNQSLGSASHVFSSSGFSITAYGWDRVSGPDTPHTLFYKNDGEDHGLGIVGTPHHELQAGSWGPEQYIQFDLGSILGSLSNGQVKVSSVDGSTHEVFDIYGSNALGQIGTRISIGGGYDSGDDNTFVDIPDFGQYRFISIAAAHGDVLPWGIQANVSAIPELGGRSVAIALLAFCGLVLASRSIRGHLG